MQTAPVTIDAPAVVKPATKSRYIVGWLYDGIFFIFSPLLALGLGIAIASTPLERDQFDVLGHKGSVTSIFIGSFIFAHLFIVFFRSHGNREIFKLHPWRFTLVPLLLFAAILSSRWIMITMAVLAIWWDVYHSSLQTFGLGRIYDAKSGNNPALGRRLDYILNLLLYAGPILAGITLYEHMEKSFDNYATVGSVFLTSIPAYAESYQRYLTIGVMAFAVPFLSYYIYAYWRMSRQGYQVSMQKVLLYVSTAACSVYTWGFDTFGEAFFIMNFFHALQYFALVWWTEQKTMISLFRLGNIPWGKPIALLLYLAIGFAYGLWAEVSTEQSDVVFATVLVVSLMHFWYDGFIWSVRKKQV
jgi:hypothetical protein